MSELPLLTEERVRDLLDDAMTELTHAIRSYDRSPDRYTLEEVAEAREKILALASRTPPARQEGEEADHVGALHCACEYEATKEGFPGKRLQVCATHYAVEFELAKLKLGALSPAEVGGATEHTFPPGSLADAIEDAQRHLAVTPKRYGGKAEVGGEKCPDNVEGCDGNCGQHYPPDEFFQWGTAPQGGKP